MVLLGLTLNIVRLIYLDAVPPERLTPAAAASVFDALVYFIRLGLRSVLVLFLAIAMLAWVTGPAAQPTAVRRGLGRGVAALRSGTDRAGLDTGAFGTTLHSLLTPIRIGILGVALLAYMMAGAPDGNLHGRRHRSRPARPACGRGAGPASSRGVHGPGVPGPVGHCSAEVSRITLSM